MRLYSMTPMKGEDLMKTPKIPPKASAATAFVAMMVGWNMGLAAAPLGADQRVVEAYGRIPLHFELNQGQTDGQVKFLSRGGRSTLFLTPNEAVLLLASPQSAQQNVSRSSSASSAAPVVEAGHSRSIVLRVKLLGAKPNPVVTGVEELPGKVNYFIGNDPKKWRTDVPIYAKARYADVYPGVDLIYYGSPGQLEYDFIVAPRADPRTIALSVEGAEKLEVDVRGDLVLWVAGGAIRQRRPLIYQEVNGVRREIPGGYVLKGKGRVGFQVSAYDAASPLVIDPVLVYSTYLGGGRDDFGGDVAVDSTGSAYVTGRTQSANFPTTAGSFDTGSNGGEDAFVTRLNAAGSALVYSTYLGGSDDDSGNGIAVDSAGNAWVAGATRSPNFPTTAGAFDTISNGDADGFVTKLAPTGSVLLYSTYLGGRDLDTIHAIAVDAAGNTYVTGRTLSTNFPTTPGSLDTSLGGPQDAFVTKVNAAGTALLYSTFLGGSSIDMGNGITVDAAGNAYVAGETTSGDFPTTPGAWDLTLDGTGDAFVTKLNAAGNALVYSTYLGGPGNEIGTVVAVDPSGNAYVSGHTFADGFPTTPGAFDTTYNGGPLDVFVTKLDATGSTLLYSTYLGGSGSDFGFGIGVDSAGNAHLAGETRSADFPTTPDAVQPTAPGGFSDCFVTRLNAAGSALTYSTYLGGTAGDACFGLALDPAGSTYVTGDTTSIDFPATPGSFDTSATGGFDVFVAKIGASQEPMFEYAVKILCGVQTDPKNMRLARGFYATAINVHNPNTSDVKFFKKLALTFPPAGQRPGKVMRIGEDKLGPDEALEVDCEDLQKRLFPGGFPTPYIKGFVVIQSPDSLDVTAVYTTATLDKKGQVADHSSIDVEQIRERQTGTRR
jgi:Beta-propeller repeat